MPVQVSYPGVYIQELPSGSRTIGGVATSITAFVGRAARGPTDTAVLIHSQGDYDRQFGGLDALSPMSFAVRDFFRNGGSTAVIVRLYHEPALSSPPASPLAADHNVSTIPIFDAVAKTWLFDLVAANPGRWGANLRVVIDNNVSDATATAMGVDSGDLFNMTVTDTVSGTVEVHRNVTMVDSSRRIDRVLYDASDLVRYPPGTWQQVTPLQPHLRDDQKDSDNPTTIDMPGTTLAGTSITAEDQFSLAATDPPTQTANEGIAAVAMEAQDGTWLTVDDFQPTNAEKNKTGLWSLEQTDLFNLLVIPPNVQSTQDAMYVDGNLGNDIITLALPYCRQRRALMILDSPEGWTSKEHITPGDVVSPGSNASYSALFFPRIEYPNPFNDNRLEPFCPSGAIAGIMARTDSERGVWKAPAGLDAVINGVTQLTVDLTDMENGDLNPQAINCLRNKPEIGPVVWGSRTQEGDDRLQSQWKYIPVRRIALFLEESLFRGTQWVVFEPNDEPLWSQIRTSITAFMQGLFLQGAFQGSSPEEAYFVKCDDETTTQADIDNGIVNILVGFAPLKPAEFVVISLQQMAGQTV
jgi:Bacteriophage tail sheath protein